ncbi:UNVERIFIED_CONTAM: hypothetical protein PYX00_003429 [Menopon gallinae]|uniref:Spermatogenesis-associated protein 13 n=1 Tax=Menopon gallinae TaxID=328185 RepID=A0AAW2I1W9_9NEOP
MHTHWDGMIETNGNVRLRNRNMLKSVLESKVRRQTGKPAKNDPNRHSWHAVSLSDVHAVSETNLTWDRAKTNSMEDGLQNLAEKPRRTRVRSGANGLFPWKRQFVGTNSTSGLRPSTPEMSKTAPATPVRDLGSGNSKEKERAKQTQYVRSSSTPLLDEPPNVNSEWGLRRDISQGTEESTKEINSRINQKELLGQRNILGNQTSESVLQKFKKSFSLRFQKPQKGSAKDGFEDADDLTEDGHEEEPPPPPAPAAEQKNNNNNPQAEKEESTYDQKFRFGPLVWRSSKERKKGKKAVRNAKCNSGDSGIQIENSLYLPGDSSESHDTDQHDELDSPPVIRRRTASAEKSSRPQSEVINQILIDKFKADLQWRAQTKGYPNRRVRRTNSDLGGQRLFNWELRNNYRRMMSMPSPVKGRPSRTAGNKLTPDGSAVPRRRMPGRGQLRRSMSQPLGLNELSPLMRRKPSVVRNQILSEDEHDGRGATSDDEALSDSESSVTSLNDRKKSFEAAMDEEVVVLAEAVWDHVAMEPEELAFRAGDVIEVLDTLDRDWWWGATGDNYGWFPSAFVRLRVSQEDTVEDCLEAMASGNQSTKQIRRRTSISLLSNDQVRSSVVRELLNTERDFVKVLRDVTEGYIAECRRRTDMFSATQIETIFSNMEDLLAFQTQFLEDLEVRVDREAPHRSCVGEIFLKHRAGFRMYSEYCNSHPMAIATLQELYQRNSYSKFFEACRLMRGLIEIPLDGYLLTPVQRICKYPLQLAELLKYTKPDHPDHHKVKEALETMRDVAVLINERKRRMESLEKLAAWQQRVEGWEGEDLIEVSTQLIHQGEAVRVTSGMWTTNITIFLFDHQLVYCKKDLLKRNTYVYKGRICMDTSEVIDIPDGKDPQSGVTIRHGIKIYSCIRDKWLLFCCRNAEEKSKWLDALSEERKLVAQDRKNDLELPAAARQLARMAARSKRRPPNEPRSKTYKRETSHYNGYKVGRKVGTWFTFGGAKKSSRMNLRTRNAPQHVM